MAASPETVRLWRDTRVRHELKQLLMRADWEEWPSIEEQEYRRVLLDEVRRRLRLHPVQECVCEECWPLTAAAARFG